MWVWAASLNASPWGGRAVVLLYCYSCTAVLQMHLDINLPLPQVLQGVGEDGPPAGPLDRL